MKQTNRQIVTIAMLVVIFMTSIDMTIVSTAMPHIVRELKGLALYNWVFAVYALTSAVTTPIFGKLADLFGRKVIFTIGVVLFVLGSILSGASQNMVELVWFRAFQGIGAGAVMPITNTLIGDLYPGEQRARMQGVFTAVLSVSGLLGPLAGGLFVDHLSWRWIFYINVPVGALAIILVLLFLHEQFRKRSRKIDYLGAAVFTVGITSLLYALLNGGDEYPWDSGVIILLFVVSAVFIGLFIWVEAKVPEPMLPLELFRIPVIAVSNMITFFISAVLIGVNVYLPMWIQSILGHSATNSGLTLMPMSLVLPLSSTLAGRYMYRRGTKRTIMVGVVLVALGSAWMLAISLRSPYWYFVGLMIVIGFGMGYSQTPMTVMIQSAVGWQMRGVATASNTFVRLLAQTTAITIFGTMFNSSTTSYARQNAPKGVLLGNVLRLIQTTKTMPPPIVAFIHHTLAFAIHRIFFVMFCFTVLSFISALFLPSHHKVMEQQKSVSQPSTFIR